MKSLARCFSFLVLLAVGGRVEADEGANSTSLTTLDESEATDAVTIDSWGGYHLWTHDLNRFDVDLDGNELDTDLRIFHRLRAGASVETEFGLELVLELDALADELSGRVTPYGVGIIDGGQANDYPFHRRNLMLRNGYAALTTGVGQLRAGLMSSQWGMGILANSGNGRDDLFGTRTRGDVVLRAAFATKPLLPALGEGTLGDDVYLALAHDFGSVDSNGDSTDGDDVSQVIGALFYRADGNELGVYVVHRDQTDEDGDTVVIDAFDLMGQFELDLDRQTTIGFAGEVAYLNGETTRVNLEASPDLAQVEAVGFAVRVYVALPRYQAPDLATFSMDIGYASGDANPDDDTVFRFRFHPDFNIGLVLFDHYIPAITRRAVERVADPVRAAVPPKGLEGLVSNGGIENAIYFAPSVVLEPTQGLAVGIGVLYAEAAEEFMDPYSSFAAGGAATGPFGGVVGDALGVELDLAIRYRYELGTVTPEVRLQYGHLVPGSAFANAAGETPAVVDFVEARFGLLF
jgi:hypothetical protein